MLHDSAQKTCTLVESGETAVVEVGVFTEACDMRYTVSGLGGGKQSAEGADRPRCDAPI